LILHTNWTAAKTESAAEEKKQADKDLAEIAKLKVQLTDQTKYD
jgi:hypothetical protein